jgi:hypothetical protein
VHCIKRSIAPKFQQKNQSARSPDASRRSAPGLASAKVPRQWAARAITACWIGIANRPFIDGEILCAACRAIA